MFYLIINDQIRKYIDMIKDKHFGCKKYCPLQIIALDEMELLRKELKKIGINFTNEEFKALITSTESKYFHHVHTCITPEEEKQREIYRQKISEIKEKSNIEKNKISENENSKNKKCEEENIENSKNEICEKSEFSFKKFFSMIFLFFIIVIGSYYLGKYIFGLSDSNTVQFVLIVTIIVFLTETCLLLLSIHKEDMKNIKKNVEGINREFGRYRYSDSFAYKFNKNYRNKVEYNNSLNDKQKYD